MVGARANKARVQRRGEKGGPAPPTAFRITPREGKLTQIASGGAESSDGFFGARSVRSAERGDERRRRRRTTTVIGTFAVRRHAPSSSRRHNDGGQRTVTKRKANRSVRSAAVDYNRPPTGARLIPVDHSWTSPERSVIYRPLPPLHHLVITTDLLLCLYVRMCVYEMACDTTRQCNPQRNDEYGWISALYRSQSDRHCR